LIRKIVVALVAFGILLGAGAGLWAWQGLQSLQQPVPLEQTRLLEVPQGTTLSHLAYDLQAEGLIRESLWLRLYGKLYPQSTRIKAGEYELAPGMSTLDIIDKMVAGITKVWSVQFIEGTRFADARAALAGKATLAQDTAQMSDEEIMAALGQPDQHPEGWFFPDTYLYERGTSDLEILRRSLERMQETLETEWANRAPDLPYKTPYEAMIMASIVEKETGVPSERNEVAGVFVRRLNKGMRLQTDPTVIYGMGDRYKGNIRRKDLRTATPYNTYVIPALPPTPIALFGREALHATLHPAAGTALYFVARGDGSHVFSDTLAEHQKAVRNYQLNLREDYRSSPPPANN